MNLAGLKRGLMNYEIASALISFDAIKQRGQRHIQGIRDEQQMTQGRIAPSLFNAPHVGPMHVGLVG